MRSSLLSTPLATFRCRKHRQAIQQLWQISAGDDDTLAGRPLEGNFREAGLAPGGWIREARSLAPGLYCQMCLAEGDVEPLPDYDLDDLNDAGLTDVPHIGMTADDFDLDATWRQIEANFGGMIVATRERPSASAKFDGRLRTDPRLQDSLRNALFDRRSPAQTSGRINQLQSTPPLMGAMWSSKPPPPVARASPTGFRF